MVQYDDLAFLISQSDQAARMIVHMPQPCQKEMETGGLKHISGAKVWGHRCSHMMIGRIGLKAALVLTVRTPFLLPAFTGLQASQVAVRLSQPRPFST